MPSMIATTAQPTSLGSGSLVRWPADAGPAEPARTLAPSARQVPARALTTGANASQSPSMPM